MFLKTLEKIGCPKCRGELLIREPKTATTALRSGKVQDVVSGELECGRCKLRFPILAGVAILTEDVGSYLIMHVKGVSKRVPDDAIPKKFRKDYLLAKAEIETEHIEEDLESERVNALYLMTHFLNARAGEKDAWWRPENGAYDAQIDRLIRDHWDQGPFSKIQQWLKTEPYSKKKHDAVELGCGVGGLLYALHSSLNSYLGVDSSFLGIALARERMLQAKKTFEIQIPGDLFQGPLARTVTVEAPQFDFGDACDFVVGDIENSVLKAEAFDLSISLNAIDMLYDPSALPKAQNECLKKGGIAIQSSPYIWHESVIEQVRKTLARQKPANSAQAVQMLYERADFEIEKTLDHVPWLFYKHLRQIELYSVHMLLARK